MKTLGYSDPFRQDPDATRSGPHGTMYRDYVRRGDGFRVPSKWWSVVDLRGSHFGPFSEEEAEATIGRVTDN